MNLKNMITRLTSNYNKNENSNIYKLFSILAPEVECLKDIFEKIESWQGIKNAQGHALDLIGDDVRQERLGLNDEQYRPMLRFKVSLNKSNADIDSVNTAIKSITEDNFIRLHEGYDYINEPASIVIRLKSFDKNVRYDLIDDILAAGVRANLKVEKQTLDRIYVGSVTLCGETTTIYPYNIRTIENKATVYVATGYSAGIETIEILPKR